MIKNYFKIAWRNLINNRVSSLINIGGLAMGMAVAILIGLWIWDEISFDTNFKNYDRIAKALQNNWINNETQTWDSEGLPLAPALRASYGSNFKHVIMTSWTGGHILSYGEKNLNETGNYMEPGIIDMLSLKIVKGSPRGLDDPESILLSETVAKSFFGDADPINKLMKIDKKLNVKVTGVYEDLPQNCSFGDLTYIAPFQLLAISEHYATRFNNPWGASWFQTFVQVADNVDMKQLSAKIKNVKLDALKSKNNTDARFRPEIFLHPMSRWHLYSDFKNGINIGGRIQYVWLFGIIGVFVLLLACINFMNLSTARSEKRAREVGIRKAIGSVRSQLIAQFYSESLLISVFAFLLALVIAQLCLPVFNDIAGKKMSVLWGNPLFWLFGIAFTLFTGIIAGSYPALYLSSFRPVKVLKGTFKVGRLAAVPRKVLVVVQFSVSVVLIIGTIVVFQQIQFAKNRPVGYSRNGIITVSLQTDDINKQYNSVRNDLLASGSVVEVAESESSITSIYVTNGGFKWTGKDPSLQEEFVSMSVTPEFGKTIDWKIKEGRDFSRAYVSDSTCFIINEAAVKFMGLKHPTGETIEWIGNGKFKIIGVVKDMITNSPYSPIRPTFFYTPRFWNKLNTVDIKINPLVSAHDALAKIGAIFKKYDPSTPFNYQFIDEQYAKKFDNEERIGKLASCFAGLAIFISCLGLFGMAMFMAEQRVKEIGVRKVLGATVFNLWQLLSKDFVALIIISLLIATPVSWYFMHKWLLGYEYRTEITWWVFAVAAIVAMMLTLLTVSYQSIKAALANPVKSLRSE
jgi:ABC-type antimicrobial peptide transport system permease subunit